MGHEFSLGSVVVLPKSKYYLWFTYLLKPFEHFVPVEEDLSDLIDKINYIEERPELYDTISNNLFEFAKKTLTIENVNKHIIDTLKMNIINTQK